MSGKTWDKNDTPGLPPETPPDPLSSWGDIEQRLAMTFQAKPIVLPDDGRGPILELICGATRSILVKQFSFDDPILLDALLAARRRGVKVNVLLNARRSSGSRANDATFAALKAGDVAARWANPNYYVSHEKSMVVDSSLALVATFNFTSRTFACMRDYGVIIDDIAAIADIAACFAADWRRAGFNPAPDTPLIWSKGNSRALMAHFIDRAKKTLYVQHPKFVDATILDRLVLACQRGVDVRILCGGKSGISDFDMPDTFSSLRMLKPFGAKIRRQKKTLRLHAKLLLADKKYACLGSMNIDRNAFDLRRELGILLNGGPAVKRFLDLFDQDWEHGSSYDPPDPVSVLPTMEEEDELSVQLGPDDVEE